MCKAQSILDAVTSRICVLKAIAREQVTLSSYSKHSRPFLIFLGIQLDCFSAALCSYAESKTIPLSMKQVWVSVTNHLIRSLLPVSQSTDRFRCGLKVDTLKRPFFRSGILRRFLECLPHCLNSTGVQCSALLSGGMSLHLVISAICDLNNFLVLENTVIIGESAGNWLHFNHLNL